MRRLEQTTLKIEEEQVVNLLMHITSVLSFAAMSGCHGQMFRYRFKLKKKLFMYRLLGKLSRTLEGSSFLGTIQNCFLLLNILLFQEISRRFGQNHDMFWIILRNTSFFDK